MIKSIAKILLQPRRFKPGHESGALVILGNGPSLRQTIDNQLDQLRRHPLMAVNYMANTPEFRLLKPQYYVLADPHFFRAMDDPMVQELWRNLRAVEWPMTLLVPYGVKVPEGVACRRYPFRAGEGPKWFRHFLFAAGLSMPRPRNVMIPSIMLAIWLGFKEIYIVGADHTWIKTLSVNERNEVISIQPHFYKDGVDELERQRIDYMHRPLHDVLQAQTIAFRAYHTIQEFAAPRGIRIYNSTPGSYIDAFPRKSL